MLHSNQNVHVQQLVRAAKHYSNMTGGTKPINSRQIIHLTGSFLNIIF